MSADKARIFHVIPVPDGWSVEQAWEAICRGELFGNGHYPLAWAAIEVDEEDRFIKVVEIE